MCFVVHDMHGPSLTPLPPANWNHLFCIHVDLEPLEGGHDALHFYLMRPRGVCLSLYVVPERGGYVPGGRVSWHGTDGLMLRMHVYITYADTLTDMHMCLFTHMHMQMHMYMYIHTYGYKHTICICLCYLPNFLCPRVPLTFFSPAVYTLAAPISPAPDTRPPVGTCPPPPPTFKTPPLASPPPYRHTPGLTPPRVPVERL